MTFVGADTGYRSKEAHFEIKESCEVVRTCWFICASQSGDEVKQDKMLSKIRKSKQ